MYKKFFGLARNPFELSPDPRFLFLTEPYNEALAAVYYGVSRRKGFVLMTGEVGTGKTLLVRCLMELLTKQQIAFANVFNPLLSGSDFLSYVAKDLGIISTAERKGGLLHELNLFLINRHKIGLTTVLIVDEAQNLPADVLEEIRLLTNLETGTQKLLQIVLVGQPELEEKLDSTDLRQLKQRIALRCRLRPLNQHEVSAYVSRRLILAGFAENPELLFPAESIALIFQYSQGIPRLINTICEHSLITGFTQRTRTIPPSIVEAVSIEFRLGPRAVPAETHSRADELLQATRVLLQVAQTLHTPSREPRGSADPLHIRSNPREIQEAV